MTNAPISRKTHVIRILGTNAAGEVLSDMWADVERWDTAKAVLAGDIDSFEGHQFKFKWCDDPTNDDYNPDGNPSRLTRIVKVCDPTTEDDIDNPEEWIPIPAIVHAKLAGSKNNFQGEQQKFLVNDTDDGTPLTSRVVEQVRIYHYDTNIDDAAQAAFDADSSLKVYVVQGTDYTKFDALNNGPDGDTKDDSQYVEHEVVKYFKATGNPSNFGDPSTGVQGNYQGRETNLKNQYLIDESVPAQLKEIGANGINPPYRLDAYQNIININFGGLAVEFLDKNK